MPEGAVYVGRPSRWGNPYRIDPARPPGAQLAEYLAYLLRTTDEGGRSLAEQARDELRGRDLACWCPLDAPCHADVLLRVVNGEERDERD